MGVLKESEKRSYRSCRADDDIVDNNDDIDDNNDSKGVLTVTLSLSQGLSILLPPSNSKSTKSILTTSNDQ